MESQTWLSSRPLIVAAAGLIGGSFCGLFAALVSAPSSLGSLILSRCARRLHTRHEFTSRAIFARARLEQKSRPFERLWNWCGGGLDRAHRKWAGPALAEASRSSLGI